MIAGKRFASTALAALMLAVPLVMKASPAPSQASPNQSARGKYLVRFGGCIDCHTPGYFLGKPDMAGARGLRGGL